MSSGHDKPAPKVILDKGDEDEEDEQFVVQDSAALQMQLPEEGFTAAADVTPNQKPEGRYSGQLVAELLAMACLPSQGC